MNKYWFKQKRYGYGITPVSWEGWVMTFVLMGIILAFILLQRESFETENVLGIFFMIAQIVLLSIVFLLLLSNRTEGKLGWRWGNKK